MERVQAVVDAAAAAGASAALLSDRASLRWVGAAEARHLLVRGDAAIAIADGDPCPLPSGTAIERIDPAEPHAAAAALARALSRVGLRPGEPVATELGRLPRSLACVIGGEECRDIGGAVTALRARKDEADLAAIGRAAALVDTGHRALRARLRAGLTGLALWQGVHAAIVAAAGEHVPARAELTAGPRTALTGVSPGRDAIAAGAPVVLALACERDGLWAAATATVCCGDPSPELRRRHAVVLEALANGVRAARLGVTTGEVDRAMRQPIEDAGFACPLRTGYAIGHSPAETPELVPNGTVRLSHGTVLVLEPGMRAADGGVRLGRTTVVTADGGRPLTARPSTLV